MVTLGVVLAVLGVVVAVSLVFVLGRWRGRAELLGDVPMRTQMRVLGRFDETGNMRVVVAFTARAGALVITGEKDMMVSREDWLAAFPAAGHADSRPFRSERPPAAGA